MGMKKVILYKKYHEEYRSLLNDYEFTLRELNDLRKRYLEISISLKEHKKVKAKLVSVLKGNFFNEVEEVTLIEIEFDRIKRNIKDAKKRLDAINGKFHLMEKLNPGIEQEILWNEE